MAFSQALRKHAFVGAVAGAAGRAALSGARLLGRGLVRAGGGKLNTALTAMDAGNQFDQNMNRVKQQVSRGPGL